MVKFILIVFIALLTTCVAFHQVAFKPRSSAFTSGSSRSLNPIPFSTSAIATADPQRRLKRTSMKMGILDSFKKIVGGQDLLEALTVENDKQLKEYMQRVEKINALEEDYEQLSNEALKAKTQEFRQRIKNGESLDSLLVEAFATVREAAWRVLELRHFDVQLMGGMALHDGRLAEMATGEGKTLVAVLPVYLNALGGEGSFVVTTNDYLARRDGETMGQVYRFLGLSVGVVQNYQKEEQRKQAYNCDITYVANQEIGFDFLRDNLAMGLENVVQTRPFNFCVVDEADSILIDEARTPLIISRRGSGPTNKYISSAQIAQNLEKDKHYEVNEKDQKVELTPAGFKFAEQIVGKGLYELGDPWAFYIINGLKAKELFFKDKGYIVADGQISIIDSFTGRVLEGRRFTDGLQQAIEAKEGLQVSSETQTVAKVTYQNLFRLFPKLSGMTGTAMTDAQEFLETYQLKTIPIPTALPIARRDNPDAVFRTQEGKMKAMLKNVLSTHEKGRPILIGTTSVEASEEVAQALTDLGVKVKVLNARPENVERESEIVSQAGRVGAVTVSTNMAGRGTDILLGGSAKGIAKVLAKHMLLVRMGLSEMPPALLEELGEGGEGEDTEVEQQQQQEEEEGEDGAVAKASGESDGEGDEDEESEEEEEEEEEEETDPDVLALPSIPSLAAQLDLWLPKTPSKSAQLDLQRAVVSCSDLFATEEEEEEEETGKAAAAVTTAGAGDSTSSSSTKSAGLPSVGRIEVEEVVSQAADSSPTGSGAVRLLRAAINRLTKEFEAAVKEERNAVKKLGGLYVIGTSKHESRRVDNQLRGRAGRQGDMGASRFFLSLEDDIFRLFGADKLAGMMDNFRVAEDMPIESELVGTALDKVQGQVEDYFRGTRAQVFRLDEVASYQRNVVYSQRRAFLTSTDEGMLTTFTNYCMQTMEEIYGAALVGQKGKPGSPGGPVNAEKLHAKARQFFPNLQLTVEDISSTAPAEVLELLKSRLDVAIQEKRKEVDTVSAWAFVAFFRYLALVQVDESWCKQLTRLDLLKEEMVLQSFTAEKDVMETYRENAMELFSSLMDDVRRNTVYSLFIYNPTAGK